MAVESVDSQAGSSALAAGSRRRIVVAGGAGFMGRLVQRFFNERGWEVIVLSRRPSTPAAAEGVRMLAWDGQRLA